MLFDHSLSYTEVKEMETRYETDEEEFSREHERALEHMNDARSFSTKSHIIKHWMTTHPDLPSPPTMIFSVKAQYRECLSRQIGEALRINFTRKKEKKRTTHVNRTHS